MKTLLITILFISMITMTYLAFYGLEMMVKTQKMYEPDLVTTIIMIAFTVVGTIAWIKTAHVKCL